VRTHLALGKDTPLGRAVQRSGVIVAVTAAVTPSNLSLLSSDRRVQLPSAGNIIAFPEVGGLHHRYERRARNIGETTRYLSLPSITPN
jgi:hypothetical protein